MVVSRPSEGLEPRHYASERTFSLDDTCGYVNGQGNGLYCNPGLKIGGACCSVNGKCGSTVEFCGRGCQEGYGECFNDGRGLGRGCGLEHSNAHCQPGLCCSEFGICGIDDVSCGCNCQPSFGGCYENDVLVPNLFECDGGTYHGDKTLDEMYLSTWQTR